jgi:hypothetical protein
MSTLETLLNPRVVVSLKISLLLYKRLAFIWGLSKSTQAPLSPFCDNTTFKDYNALSEPALHCLLFHWFCVLCHPSLLAP